MDKTKDNYKSHIQLTRQLVKPYTIKDKDNTKIVKLLDLNTLEIKTEKIKDLDTEKKYFEPAIEELLDKQFESPFGQVSDKIRKGIKANFTNFSLSIIDLTTIRKFFQSCFLRNKEFFSQVKDSSDFARYIKGFNPSVVIGFGDAINYLFYKKEIGFIVNTSDSSFVCPHNLIFYLYDNKINNYLMCICVNKNLIIYLNINSETNHINICYTDNTETINAINLATYLTERNHKESYIVGDHKDLLVLKDSISITKNKNIDIIAITT